MSTRRARIEIKPVDHATDNPDHVHDSRCPHYLITIASNGEPLSHSENHPTWAKARRAVAAHKRAMRQILDRDETP